MAFSAFFDFAVLVLLKTTRTERDRMIKLDARAHLCLFAEDYASAVLEKRMPADFCPRMNINPRSAVSPFRHDAGNQRHLVVKQVRHSMNGDRLQRGIGKNNF